MVSAQQMKVALEAYESAQQSPNPLSKREVARRYDIPWSSFRDCTNGKKPGSRRGAPCALTSEEEDALVQGLIDIAAQGFPATRWKLKLMAMDIARDGWKHPFGANGPTDKWVNGFLRRHSDRLSMRKSRILDASRVHAFNSDDINCFFEEYEQYVRKHQLPPTRIYNCDESGIDPRGGETFKVIAARGAKNVCEKRGDNRENTAVLMAVSASGVIVPPVFLFRGKLFFSNLLHGGPPGCRGTVTENAFIDTPTFEFWIDHFVENIPPARPVLLILDNHKAHVALSVLEKFRSHQIDVLALPPHTTHLLQPCDDGCFRAFKAEWRKQIQKWSSDTRGASLPRSMVAAKVRDTIDCVVTRRDHRIVGEHRFVANRQREGHSKDNAGHAHQIHLYPRPLRGQA